MINKERLWSRLNLLSEIGKTDTNGVTRLSFTPEERAAKDLVAAFMIEAGLKVREDEVGNLIGRKDGGNPNASVVLTGSHIDSVLNGGNFDGPLGVLSAVEALQVMNEQNIETEHPIEVIAFTDEEGARFSFGMIGSRGIAGTLTQEELLNKDKHGITIAEAFVASGLKPDTIGKAARKPEDVKAYIELHIEQGKVLEGQNLSAGIVSGLAGPLWLKFILEGEVGHAGATPMSIRHDALTTAARVMLVIEAEAAKTGTTVGTVGQVQVQPGGINIIPGRVEFSLDLRDISEVVRDEVEQNIREQAQQICETQGVKLTIEDLQRVAPAPCSVIVKNAARDAFEKLGLESYYLPSGAGHDGMQLLDLCPMGMIFIRSKNGISHDPAEWSSKEDCADGANVLYHTVLNLAVQKVNAATN
ncbi:Zn-dependent hydrolase [Bacillus sp. ISL-40]|uniref:Zn-dependent hydrolase n=1 Tax=unclassified Bacillus (in: firmicutes) TaxID=185979 RepID=UPI001BE93866|nr:MULTISPECIES: Zn-dependent hydrolase [unclassified Bacillus (in: firmicutes)]MBT2696275.1 Zn-dependent hydrolase [Bacillus sp. ISL-40]MBT2720431.1 Zn-dependent hydrolase [Bacillus sp. ISL-46]MBT2743124.1 Zn-dependent hydrolase [Bacillus sp. ISL-77]